MKLTKKQEELFNQIESPLRKETAIQFIKGGYDSGRKAYVKACKKLNRKPSKNPDTSASEILNYPKVVEFINSVKIAVAESAQIDAAWLLKSAKQVFDRCMQVEKPSGEDGATGEYKFEHSGANKALEIIGKHVDVQAFVTNTKVEHSVTDDFAALMMEASDD